MLETCRLEPKVFVGCLTCISFGDVVGVWKPAIYADQLTVDLLHRETDIDTGDRKCEKLWIFKHELPLQAGIDPSYATAWAHRTADINYELRPAFDAWIKSSEVSLDKCGLPLIADFHTSFAGDWPDFRTFADQMVEDLGLINGAYPEIEKYFDYESWAADLLLSYNTIETTDGEVHIFRIK